MLHDHTHVWTPRVEKVSVVETESRVENFRS